tara:strand:+ start:464 stop:673 length:210 start_codon:yes stop_codon:yes gene_type:complete
MNKKIIDSIKSGIGSYILLIFLNYIIYMLTGWTVSQEMLPAISYDFMTLSFFLFLTLFVVDYFFYKGKY